MSASLHQATLLGVYLLNQDFITENFCVNKDKPEMSCNGKCHLKDMVAMADEDKGDTTQLSVEFAMFPVFIQNIEVFTSTTNWQSFKMNDAIQTLISSYQYGAFHPPEFA